MAWMRVIVISLAGMLVFGQPRARAGERIVEQDLNNDGSTDRVAHVSPSGLLVKLEADTDGDGRMDSFQYYEEGVVVRLERDTDRDGRIDERTVMTNGIRSSQERLNAGGEVTGTVTFDGRDRPSRWQRDTTGDGRADTVSLYEEGELRSVTRDTTGDGRVNVREGYRGGVIRERASDTDGDGTMETVRMYRNGELYRQEQDGDGNGSAEVVTEYRDGMAVSEKRDTNNDGAFDVLVRMHGGKPSLKEEDLDHDGRMDRFTDLDSQGRPAIVREFGDDPSEPILVSRFEAGRLSSLEQPDHRGRTLTRFKDGRPIRQVSDEDGDGRPDRTIVYDDGGEAVKAVGDTNHDGHTDTWQKYEHGTIVHAELDRDHDGRPDARLEYTGGKPTRTILDNDGDGRFETTVTTDCPEWSKVVEITGPEGRLLERRSYSGEVLRKREVCDEASGRPVSMEEYDGTGAIVLSRQADDGSARWSLTWRYGEDETPVSAEKDTDGDGRADTWYYYENGRVARVEQDRNRDGRPDLWEVYNTSQGLECLREDLDFDGTADIEKRF